MLDRIRQLLQTPLWKGDSGDITLAETLLFVLAILALYIAVKTIRGRLQRILEKKGRDPRAVHAALRLAEFVAWVVGALFLLELAGIGLSSLAAMFAAFGIGIGLGLQRLINDVVGSFVLLLERPVRVNDLIQLEDGQIGMVQSIGWRATRVLTLDRIEILIPNSDILSNELINWTLSDPLTRLHCKFGVHYASDPNKVRKAALEVADVMPKICKEPESSVFFMDFGDSSLDFELRVWVKVPWERDRILSDLRYALFEKFRAEGIEIPYPQRDLHLRSGFPTSTPPKPQS